MFTPFGRENFQVQTQQTSPSHHCEVYMYNADPSSLVKGAGTQTLVSRSQTLSQGKGGGGRGGRESDKVLYIELSQRLVRGTTNQIASLVCGGISDCERRINTCAQ